MAVPRIDSTARSVPDEHPPLVPTKIDGVGFQQEPRQGSGQDETEHGDERLADRTDRRRQADQPSQVSAAIREMPVDRPSVKSMKLMLLIIPSSQTTLNATANALPSGICPGRSGWRSCRP
jgi:hypothetical protein